MAVLRFRKKEETPAVKSDNTILDEYILTYPTHQNAVDIFKGEWSSQFPQETGISAGESPLFDDFRIEFLNEHAKDGIQGKRVLELGPLESAHTAMLERLGAASVTAIEANTRAYLKCLITKEALSLNASFLLGDLNAYMQETEEKFDICLASGILYHQMDPLETLQLIAKVSDTALIWTHYMDETVVEANPQLKAHFPSVPTTKDFNGKEIQYFAKSYDQALEWQGFCGGSNTTAHWMRKEDIFSVLTDLGFATIETTDDNVAHPNGPCITIFAERG